MIRLHLTIENPWSDKFDPGYFFGGKITKNKCWEFQAYRSNTIIEGTVELTHRQDHAGLRLEFGLLSLSFVFQIYDSRHWNYDKKQWEIYKD